MLFRVGSSTISEFRLMRLLRMEAGQARENKYEPDDINPNSSRERNEPGD